MSNPSTPSRKRSKWDIDDDDDEQPTSQLLPERRVKPKITPSPPASHQASLNPVLASRSRYVLPRTHHPAITSSRSVYCYERLNQIEEGSYGVVFRAKDRETNEIVALKKLKLDEEKSGFPITALREINALMTCRHENVVNVREVVVGDTLTQ